MANLPNQFSELLDKPNIKKSVKLTVNKSLICLAIISTMTCSVGAQSLENDSDGDGLNDAYELKIGSESYLSDTDGDGVKDGNEIGLNQNQPLDTDNDGVINALDYDDDNDGLPTYLEGKQDSDNDGIVDYLDPDSDNDGISDGEEAGVLSQDKNLDGIDDAFDLSRDGAEDNNGDGIDDNVKLPDHNNDGKPDYLDSNYQYVTRALVKKENKVKERVEIVTQEKSKKVLPSLTNSKNKPAKVVITKTVAKKLDPMKIENADSMIINRHTDSDNDGLSNDLEKILGTNHLSRDSDGDKVSDAIEIGLDVNSPLDSDRDGIIDALDNDDDNDGILTKLEDLNQDSTAINDDTDGDGVPNYLDANDDGDNLLTKAEGSTLDSDGDGILDYLDRNDGIQDQSDSSNTIKVTKENTSTAEPEVVVLFDGDAAALSAEQDEGLEDSSNDSIQDQLVSSLDGLLHNEDKSLSEGKQNNEDGNQKINTFKSLSSAKSHWDLF